MTQQEGKKNLFIINSALNVKKMSVYGNSERFIQTLATVESIRKYGPEGSQIVMSDSSPDTPTPEKEKVEELKRRGVEFFYYGNVPLIKSFSLSGSRSVAESLSFITLMKDRDFTGYHRIYKLSGRYCLNKNFVIDSPDYDGAFVFSNALPSWMPDIQQAVSGVSKLYRLRLWHMDGSLINIFQREMNNIYQDCIQFNLDVEHSYYKHLHKYRVVEVEKIGVQGNIAPNGEWISE